MLKQSGHIFLSFEIKVALGGLFYLEVFSMLKTIVHFRPGTAPSGEFLNKEFHQFQFYLNKQGRSHTFKTGGAQAAKIIFCPFI